MMDLHERERRFMAEHIRDRTRENLAAELFEIYLVARANADIIPEGGGDPWPPNLHLADVISKYVTIKRS